VRYADFAKRHIPRYQPPVMEKKEKPKHFKYKLTMGGTAYALGYWTYLRPGPLPEYAFYSPSETSVYTGGEYSLLCEQMEPIDAVR